MTDFNHGVSCHSHESDTYVTGGPVSLEPQYPILRIVQKRFTLDSLTDLFHQTPSRFLWESFSLVAINSRRLLVRVYSPLSIARYSFKQLSELERCRMKTLAQGFTRQHMIRTRVFLVESPELYP